MFLVTRLCHMLLAAFCRYPNLLEEVYLFCSLSNYGLDLENYKRPWVTNTWGVGVGVGGIFVQASPRAGFVSGLHCPVSKNIKGKLSYHRVD